jgi:hypothetical protein
MSSREEVPQPSDVGQFIPQADLEAWWREMQCKHPRAFTADDPCIRHQHAMGTKLQSHDDPQQQPMRVQVYGSKIMRDDMDSWFAFYIVKFEGDAALQKLHLTTAHEEDGWTVVY